MIRLAVLVFALTAPPEPQAPTADPFADNACVGCHRNLPGQLSAVVAAWKQSVHRANHVGCDGCHGGNPAVRRDQCRSDEDFKERSHQRRHNRLLGLTQPQGAFVSQVRGRNVSYFCGQCHALIKEKHLGSPHGDLGVPSCLFCHGQGSHAILPPDTGIIDTRTKSQGGRCATCHRAATMQAVAAIKDSLDDAQKSLETMQQQYAWLIDHGYKNLALQQKSSHSRETLSQLRQAFHSFNQRDINNFVTTIQESAHLTQQTYDMVVRLERAQSVQAVVGGSASLFLLAFAGLLLFYRRTCLPDSTGRHADAD